MRHSSPRISVIIPVYKAVNTIVAQLKSILAQTLPPYEVFVIDDGSEDGTKDVVTKQFPTVRYVYQEHQGVSVARNNGIERATGAWIYFADGDDCLEPTLLEHLVKRMNETQVEHAVCMLRREATGEALACFPCDEYCVASARDCFKELLLHRDPRYHAYVVTSLFNRDLIKRHRIRFIVGLNFQEDDLFYLRYLLHIKQLSLSPEMLYRYQSTPASLTERHFRQKQPMGYMHKQWAKRDKERFILSCLAHCPAFKIGLAALYHMFVAHSYRLLGKSKKVKRL